MWRGITWVYCWQIFTSQPGKHQNQKVTTENVTNVTWDTDWRFVYYFGLIDFICQMSWGTWVTNCRTRVTHCAKKLKLDRIWLTFMRNHVQFCGNLLKPRRGCLKNLPCSTKHLTTSKRAILTAKWSGDSKYWLRTSILLPVTKYKWV